MKGRMEMLTPETTQLGPPVEPTANPKGRTRGCLAISLKGLVCVALFAQIVPTTSSAPLDTRKSRHSSDVVQQYLAGGTRWLDSRHDEVVHFICQRGAPYIISLDTASLRSARVPPAEHPRYLGALREAVHDWSALMGCNRFRVELDSPYPNTRISFTRIDAPGTLATATRAGDITLNVRRDWFPGSKRHGNYGPHRRLVSFYWVVAHELGHVWGLAHSTSPDALMYPTQCSTCRWSSFEQAAGNVIRASSRAPAWSRPHYANRFFAKTPRSVVGRLLKGDLPEEPSLAAAADDSESQTCASDPLPPDTPPPAGCGAKEIPGEVALMGWLPFRLPIALLDRQAPRLERPVAGAPIHRRPRGQGLPTPPLQGELAAVLAPFDPGRRLWSGDSALLIPFGTKPA
jgi:hypothetical protein